MYTSSSKKASAPFGYMPPEWMFRLRYLGRVTSQCAGKDVNSTYADTENTQKPLKAPIIDILHIWNKLVHTCL